MSDIFLGQAPTIRPRLEKPRIRNAGEAHEICNRMWNDDMISNQNRSVLQGMLDAQPPYNKDDLRRQGQMFRCNVNWLDARGIVQSAVAPYIDQMHSLDVFIQPVIQSNQFDQIQCAEWQRIIAEEFTRTIREWDDFHFQFEQWIKQGVIFGAGFAYHENQRNWQWRAGGFQDILFPRSTRAVETGVDVVMMRRPWFLYELVDKIRDRKTAEAAGWNVDEVLKALEGAQGNDPRLARDWQKIEQEIFEGTYYYAYGSKNSMVWTDHLFVREVDGTYTHHIVGTENNSGFLYSRYNEFDNANEFMSIFVTNVGNGDLHSCRGLLFDIFPQIQALNRVQSAMIDQLMMSQSAVMSINSVEAAQDLQIIDYGPYKLLPPGVTISPNGVAPPDQGTLNVLSWLSAQRAANTGTYTPTSSGALTQPGNPDTATQVRAEIANSSVLSQSQTNLFYQSWCKVLRRQFKRLCFRDWSHDEPGGTGALDFQKALIERGIPANLLFDVLGSVTRIDAVRASGYGSPANRQMINQQLLAMAPMMAPEAQNELYRNTVSSLANGKAADLYFPRMTVAPNEVEDNKIADLENSLMRMGQPQSVAGNNLVHSQAHCAAIAQTLQAAQQGQVSPQALVTFLQPAMQHTEQHLQLLQKDPVNQDKVPQFSQIVMQANIAMQHAIGLLKKKAQADQQQQGQAQPGQDPGQQQPQLDPKEMAQIQNLNSQVAARTLKMHLDAAAAQSKIQATEQTGAHRDAALAHKITVDNTKLAQPS